VGKGWVRRRRRRRKREGRGEMIILDIYVI